MNIYPQTLAGIAALINTLDGNAEGLKHNDSGIVLGGTPLYSTDGHLIGAVNWDEDQHPYFTPASEPYGPEDEFTEPDVDEWTEIYKKMDAEPVIAFPLLKTESDIVTHPAAGHVYFTD